MTPDPLDGSKRKKVKVLLRKQIPAPLLSHITSDSEENEDPYTSSPVSTVSGFNILKLISNYLKH
jgi:hypothetical protein